MNNEIVVRAIQYTDEKHLFNLRNDPISFRWYRTPTYVTELEHSNWMKSRLSDYQFLTLVAQKEFDVIGTAYLTKKNQRYEISVAINPNSQNEKVGSMLVSCLIERSLSLGILEIYAEIHQLNSKSKLFFQALGFTQIPKTNDLFEKKFSLYRFRHIEE